ncbi:MAG: transglycosylase SLT domain-containing protein [Actinobacteria bacterium]|nr:transglycosylase SLT domain-containing protein [Actinomycetota bacterium]
MEHLHFSARARRRDRLKRRLASIAIVSLIATMLGIPGMDLGWRLIGRFSGSSGIAQAGGFGGIETSESTEGMLKFRQKIFASRPTPTPKDNAPAPAEESSETATATTTTVAAPSGSITDIIYKAAAEFGLSGAYLVSVAHCESTLNPQAVNPAGYYGLFQFGEGTWNTYGYGSIFDPTAQARTAARLIAAGQSSRWPNCA